MRKKGFSLIELMIVLAVVGILASVAWPSYQESLRRGYRSEASGMLLRGADIQEARIPKRLGYSETLSDLYGSVRHSTPGDTSTPLVAVTPSGQHHITITADADAGTYTITATPVNGDTRCGTFTYNSTGVKTISGSANINDCW